MPISIAINAGADESSSSVVATGSIQHIITPTEVAAFGIEDGPLKGAIGAYLGRVPDDAFLCSPTPWGDLYSSYGWPQVQTLMTVQSATVQEVTSSPTIIASQVFHNPSSKPALCNCAVNQEVSVTAESSWSDTTTIEVGQSISYGISFLGSGAQGETSFSFSQASEIGGSESEIVTLGTNAGVEVLLDPGQSVTAELSASKGTLKVLVTYQLSLSGWTASNYSDRYRDHHFWGIEVNGVMSAGNIPTTITLTETIEVGFYANSSITVVDSAGAQIARSVAGATFA